MNEYYATRLTHDPARAAVWRHVGAYLQRWVDPNGSVLDLAAGYSDFLRSIDAGRKVAIDTNPSLPDLAGDEVEAIVGDATDLSRFTDGEFATVFASNFLEHLDHDTIDALLVDIGRVLSPGGRLILVQPNFRLDPNRYFDDYTHRTVWTDRSLEDRRRRPRPDGRPFRAALSAPDDEVEAVVRPSTRAALSQAALPAARRTDARRRRTPVSDPTAASDPRPDRRPSPLEGSGANPIASRTKSRPERPDSVVLPSAGRVIGAGQRGAITRTPQSSAADASRSS